MRSTLAIVGSITLLSSCKSFYPRRPEAVLFALALANFELGPCTNCSY